MISPCLSMTLILAVLVSILTLAAGRNVSHGQCNLDGLCLGDLVGETRFDYDTNTEGKAACINFCRKTQGCFWYSFDMYSGLCLALEDCPTLDDIMTRPDSTHYTSGNKDCRKYRCHEPGMCHGTIIEANTYRNDCLDQCQDTPECLWFTYFPKDKACILFADDCSDSLFSCSDCFSGQRQCSSEETTPRIRNKLMLGTKHFELIDLSNSSKPNCPLPDYPHHVEHPAFMTFDEKLGLVRACGGIMISTRNSTNRCFTFDGLKWESMESTHYFYEGQTYELGNPTKYNFGSATVADIGWWIFQCRISENNITDCDPNDIISEFFSFTNGSWESGPSFIGSNGINYLPKNGFCSGQLNTTHSMLIGGYGDGDSSDSFPALADVTLYDWIEGEWTPGTPMQSPRLSRKRSKTSCTSFGSGHIMVTAGSEDLYFDETEIYDPEIDAWYYTKDLPSIYVYKNSSTGMGRLQA